MALHFPTALLTFGVWLTAARVSRVSAVGALSAYALLPAFAWWLGPRDDPWFLPFACVLAGVVLVRHAGNVRRMISGTPG